MDLQTLSAEQCAQLIRRAKRAVALTGAGISTGAGIPDFRGPEGLYAAGRYDLRAFEIGYFHKHPEEFFRFTRDVLDVLKAARPTFAHELLARLEAEGMLAGVITQNVDPLHQQAGSKNVLSVHGTYATSSCLACGKSYSYEQMLDLLEGPEVPRCDCRKRGVIKPDVVLFGEIVRDLDAAAQLAGSCDLMLVLGSSLSVQPAAALPQFVDGSIIAVNQGDVDLPRGPNRYLIRRDLDEYLREVGECLFAGG